MKTTIYTLLSCSCRCADWQPIIKAVPCLCWGIIFLIVLYLLLKYVVRPCIANCQENKMKEKAHEREKEWADRNLTKEMVENLKLSPDVWLKNQMGMLTDNIEKITNELASEKEKEEKVIESLELRKKAYEEMLNHIRLMVSLEEK